MTEIGKKTILITGGAGFIGSHLCKKYIHEGYRVICMDNLQATLSLINVDMLMGDPDFRFIKHDIVLPFDIAENIDLIFNLACPNSYVSYQFDPVHTIKTNTVGVINILELALKHNATVLQASSADIYGDPAIIPLSESYRGNVDTQSSRACYSEGKRCAETLCLDYNRQYGLDVKIARIFDTYGPNMSATSGKSITNFIGSALSDNNITIFGDGSHTRSFLYIDDLVRGLARFIREKDFIGPVNFGSSVEMTVESVARLIVNKADSQSLIVFKKTGSDDVKRRRPDITLAKDVFDWFPSTAIDLGLKETIAYFRKRARPQQKVLTFINTYWPTLGHTERSLYLMSKDLPDTKFHIVTTRSVKKLPAYEKLGVDNIHRIGFGYYFDIFLLPFAGVREALKLSKENEYTFVLAVGSGISMFSAFLVKLFRRDMKVLILHDNENSVWKKIFDLDFPQDYVKELLGVTDDIVLSRLESTEGERIIASVKDQEQEGGEAKSLINKIRFKYTEMFKKTK